MLTDKETNLIYRFVLGHFHKWLYYQSGNSETEKLGDHTNTWCDTLAVLLQTLAHHGTNKPYYTIFHHLVIFKLQEAVPVVFSKVAK